MTKVEIGNATLYLGDCKEILPTLPPAAAIVTDPPYGIEDAPIKGQGRTRRRVGAVNTWASKSWWDKKLDPAWGILACQKAPLVCLVWSMAKARGGRRIHGASDPG